jgi:stearoyl-CoA desaturase (delta-9 desaturase)
MHRMHRYRTGPHSPTYDQNVFSMIWRTRRIYVNIFSNGKCFDKKFLNNLPDYPFVDV